MCQTFIVIIVTIICTWLFLFFIGKAVRCDFCYCIRYVPQNNMNTETNIQSNIESNKPNEPPLITVVINPSSDESPNLSITNVIETIV